MSNCRDKEIQLACFAPTDGSASVTVNHTVVYDSDGIPLATYFSDRTGLVIDEAVYLGGGIASLGVCPAVCVYSTEVYRLDGLATGSSTAIDPLGAGAVGNTVTIPAGFASLTTIISRATQIDPGDGSVAKVIVDGVEYFMGSDDCGYATDLPDFSTCGCGQSYSEPVTITAVGSASVEIWVTKES